MSNLCSGVKFVKKAQYLVFLGLVGLSIMSISVTKEDVVTLESIVQVALADL